MDDDYSAVDDIIAMAGNEDDALPSQQVAGDRSTLYQKQAPVVQAHRSLRNMNSSTASLAVNEPCSICREPFESTEKVVSAADGRFHQSCFLCHECLEPFKDQNFYIAPTMHVGRMAGNSCKSLLCERDYLILYGDRCAGCGDLITDKCITALDMKWHAEHFTCDSCGVQLAGGSYVKRHDGPICKNCANTLTTNSNAVVRTATSHSDVVQFDSVTSTQSGQQLCTKCRKPILPEDDTYIVNNEKYHGYHFKCAICKHKIDSTFKQYEGKFYCQPHYDQVTAASCFFCRQQVHGRSVHALGRQFHMEHFMCFKCHSPFTTNTFWEYQGKPYCEIHYHELSGVSCSRCFQLVVGKAVGALGRSWCEHHFTCSGCDKNLSRPGVKFMEWDGKLMCTDCWHEVPSNIRKRLQRYTEFEEKLKLDLSTQQPQKISRIRTAPS